MTNAEMTIAERDQVERLKAEAAGFEVEDRDIWENLEFVGEVWSETHGDREVWGAYSAWAGALFAEDGYAFESEEEARTAVHAAWVRRSLTAGQVRAVRALAASGPIRSLVSERRRAGVDARSTYALQERGAVASTLRENEGYWVALTALGEAIARQLAGRS